MQNKKIQYKTLNYDFGNDEVSCPFEFDVEKDETYFFVMAASIVQYYNGELSEKNVKMVVEMIKNETISEESAFEIAEEDLKTHYEEDARDTFGGYYD